MPKTYRRQRCLPRSRGGEKALRKPPPGTRLQNDTPGRLCPIPPGGVHQLSLKNL